MAVIGGLGHRPREWVPEAEVAHVQDLEGPAALAKPEIAGTCHLQKRICLALLR